jgi:hypothetical protein
MVAVDRGGDGDVGETSRHELKQCHLGGGILAGNAIRAELEVRLSTHNVLVVSIIQMAIDNLLSEGQRMVQSLSDNGEVILDALVVDVLVLLKVGHLDLTGRAGGSLCKGAERSLDGSSPPSSGDGSGREHGVGCVVVEAVVVKAKTLKEMHQRVMEDECGMEAEREGEKGSIRVQWRWNVGGEWKNKESESVRDRQSEQAGG